MKRILFVALFIIATQVIEAQNLVNNPGFELFSEHPTTYGQINRATGWFSANTGSPEYFRSDASFHQGSAESGKGHAGLILFGDYPKAVEYLGTELAQTMETDKTYCISFSVKAEDSFMYIDQIGLVLSDEDLTLSSWAPIHRKTQLSTEMGKPIVPQLGWIKVEGEYLAKGGERFLTIGNFIDPDYHLYHVDEFAGREQGWNSYYYIDNVMVMVKDDRLGCTLPGPVVEEVDTPDAMVPIKDLTIYFELDSFRLNASQEDQLKLWSSQLKQLDSFQLEINGHTDSIASQAYNLSLAKRRAEQTRQWFIDHDFNKGKYILNYFGESNPRASNSNEKGRAANRRVEIKIIQHD